MKKDLNEEINKMRTMMGLNEQKLLDKIKTAAQNVGSKIQTGVNQVAQKIADKTKPQPQQQTTQQPIAKTMEEVRNEWSKINSDMSNMKGFGYSKSKDEHIVREMGQMNGRIAIMKKMGKTDVTISASPIDEKLYKDKDGTFHYLVIMDLND
jgi:sulfite reductase alpha subunit-like flavoprotein